MTFIPGTYRVPEICHSVIQSVNGFFFVIKKKDNSFIK